MDFKAKVDELRARSKNAESMEAKEEATKTAVILPFLSALGFDVFSLDEVAPEFTADIGTKKGEKVDFAFKIKGQLAMLIEAKPIGTKLGKSQTSQLYRYFNATEARLGILTNGKEVWFFSDTEKPNAMDPKPFFIFDLQNHDKNQVEELALFRKDTFDIDVILEAASNLKLSKAAKTYLRTQLDNPDDDFARFVGRTIYEGAVTKNALEQLRPAIQAALDGLVRDRLEEKLGVTFGTNQAQEKEDEQEAEIDSGIVTTEEEKQAFYIVQAICAKKTNVDNVVLRDSKSYAAVLFADNNRKPICRLHFNSKKTWYLGVFDDEKSETKIAISSVNEIYNYATEIQATLESYLEA